MSELWSEKQRDDKTFSESALSHRCRLSNYIIKCVYTPVDSVHTPCTYGMLKNTMFACIRHSVATAQFGLPVQSSSFLHKWPASIQSFSSNIQKYKRKKEKPIILPLSPKKYTCLGFWDFFVHGFLILEFLRLFGNFVNKVYYFTTQMYNVTLFPTNDQYSDEEAKFKSENSTGG